MVPTRDELLRDLDAPPAGGRANRLFTLGRTHHAYAALQGPIRTLGAGDALDGVARCAALAADADADPTHIPEVRDASDGAPDGRDAMWTPSQVLGIAATLAAPPSRSIADVFRARSLIAGAHVAPSLVVQAGRRTSWSEAVASRLRTLRVHPDRAVRAAALDVVTAVERGADVVNAVTLIVLRCRDLPASNHFYEALGIAFTVERHGPGRDHRSGRIGQTVVELYPAGDASPSLGRLGFHVGDVRAAASAALAARGRIDRAFDAARGLAFVLDPDGIKIELFGPGSPAITTSQSRWSGWRQVDNGQRLRISSGHSPVDAERGDGERVDLLGTVRVLHEHLFFAACSTLARSVKPPSTSHAAGFFRDRLLT